MQTRRDFLKVASVGAASVMMSQLEFCAKMPDGNKPNIVFIMADDLGYNELGCYGQTKIRTPNIDKLAAEGMKFSQHYSGSPVCAPSRCTLLTGKHQGHAYIRGNDELSERGEIWKNPNIEGQRPLLPGTVTIGTLLQKAGYKTGIIGKWGLGGPGSTGEPNQQGFDHWYGLLCQRQAHGYYPIHLWRNGEKDVLGDNQYMYPHQSFPKDKDPNDPASYEPYKGKQYTMDLMAEEALGFIKENSKENFFLYLPFPVPHVAIQVPDESVEEYKDKFDDTPYLGQKGYLPHQYPRAAYAAMVTRMDSEIGRILALLKELNLDDNTLVVFTSDNGPTYNGGTDSEFFESAGELNGLKGSVYEGGIRVPMIAKWPGRIEPGSESHTSSAFWDWLPTLGDIAGFDSPKDIDGISILPSLTGNTENQQAHEYLYWEYARKMQAVRIGDWKAVKLDKDSEIELYDLATDLGESKNVAASNPDIIAKVEDIFQNGRVESEHFPLKR